jgi:murein L,D-transpeptidase YafK
MFSRLSRPTRCLATITAIVSLTAFPAGGASASAAESVVHAGHERQLIKALGAIRSQRLDEARALLASLLSDTPSFKLAQVIYADLLRARSGPLPGFGAFDPAPAERLADLDAEARARLAHYLAPPGPEQVPQAIIDVNPEQRHVILVDLGRNRLFVLENSPNGPRQVADYYISIGKKGSIKERQGDQRTPIGVYRITRELSASNLPDFYGSGAYPIDYPNDMDRQRGKTGYGIWLHGSPADTYARPPRASDGCVVLSNPDFIDLGRFVSVSQTPVVIAKRTQWIDRDSWQSARSGFRQIVESWRRDWESLDTQRYLKNYSKAFSTGGKDYRKWANHKTRVNAGKTYIHVAVSDLDMFRYPGLDDVVVVNFTQDYSSSNHESRSHKRQYWKHEGDGRWRIIYEGSI